MIKVNLLEARMKERNVWYPEIFKCLDMSYQSLNKRLNGIVQFRLDEVNKIRKFLNLTKEQADEIFYFE